MDKLKKLGIEINNMLTKTEQKLDRMDSGKAPMAVTYNEAVYNTLLTVLERIHSLQKEG